jgi:signal transduction histidine kinase
MSVWDLVHPDFRETVKTRAEARLRGEALPSRYEFQMITKSGEARWLDLSARLIEFEGRPAVLGTGFDITDSKHLAQRLTRVQDEERAHIARELHDDIGQRLALLTIQLAQLQKTARSDAPSIGPSLETTRRLAEEICADAQRISHRLHPSQLAVLGLTKALAGLCEGFVARTDAEIDFVHDDIPRLPREVSACLFRIAQEALVNATKHSQCLRIIVELSMLPDAILLSVSDDGRGFDPASAERGAGLGLVSMTERARSVGGQAVVQSAVGRGTRLDVTIPLPQLNRG